MALNEMRHVPVFMKVKIENFFTHIRLVPILYRGLMLHARNRVVRLAVLTISLA